MKRGVHRLVLAAVVLKVSIVAASVGVVTWELWRTGTSAPEARAGVAAVAADIAISAFAVAGMIGMIAAFVTARATAPLHAMTHKARRIASGDTRERLVPVGPDDIKALAKAFNDAADALAHREQLMLQAARLEAIGVVVAGVSHQVNNQVATLHINQSLLDHHIRTQATAGGGADIPQRLLARNGECLARLSRLAEGLREISPDPRRKTADINLIAEACLLVMQHRTMHRRQPDADLAARQATTAPGALVGQVVLALVTNAVEAARPDDSLRILTRDDDGVVVVIVDDDGPGVPPDLRSFVFEPFFTTKPGATGLGLPLARQAARSAGGDVTLEPSARGARFVARFPAHVAAAPGTIADAEGTPTDPRVH